MGIAAVRPDALARFLDALRNRRTTGQVALGGLAALLGAANLEDTEAGKARKRRKRRRRKKCSGGKTRCGGKCVNTNTDPAHCGRCGNDCESGEQCRNGVCGCDVCDDVDACPFQSVQDAVNAAAEGATVTICPGEYDATVVITKDLTLAGAGAGSTTLKATQSGNSVLIVRPNVIVAVRGVTITGGSGTPHDGEKAGGGIMNRGILTVSDSIVTDNEANFGGGIFNFDQARLTLTGTAVTDNRAPRPAAGGSLGGGILNRFGARLTINGGGAITGNRADNGGGIYNNGDLVISDSSITGNEVEADGGGVVNDQGLITLSNVIVQDNTSTGRGGGLLNIAGRVTLQNGARILENHAGTSGGGIFNEAFGTVIATDVGIHDNEAHEDGGGAHNNGGHVTLTQASVQGNTANERGGGLFQANAEEGPTASLTLNATSVTGNDAGDDGGGIFNLNDGDVTLDAQSSVTENDPNNCVGTDACGA